MRKKVYKKIKTYRVYYENNGEPGEFEFLSQFNSESKTFKRELNEEIEVRFEHDAHNIDVKYVTLEDTGKNDIE